MVKFENFLRQTKKRPIGFAVLGLFFNMEVCGEESAGNGGGNVGSV